MTSQSGVRIMPGSIVAGRYRVTREIGRGGMAQVYGGEHIAIGKQVAIKVLSSEFVGSKVVVERFLREARAAAAVRSPYICDVFDSGKLDDGRPFLVMELLEGETLYDRMLRLRQLDAPTVARVVAQVARGLTKAHAAGIVHRDLKPENIFLTTNEDGELVTKLLDFGLAKFYSPVEARGAQARLTREGAIFGTPAYMSPEQVKGQAMVDERADLWALGCIVYECFVGRTVWETEQGMAMTFAQIASAPLPDLARERADLPPTVGAWFERALARPIDERFQTAKDFADSLAIALGLLPPSREGSFTGAPRPSLRPGPEAARDSRDSPELARVSGPVAALPHEGGPVNQSPLPDSLPGEATFVSPPRPHVASLVDTGTTSTVEAELRLDRRRRASIRAAILAGMTLALAGVGVGGWRLLAARRAQSASHSLGPVMPSASAPAASSGVSSASAAAAFSTPAPRWVSLIAFGQGQVARGDLDGAAHAFREALDASGSPEARTLADYVAVAQANKGPCVLRALGRLRPHSLAGGTTSRPTLIRTGKSLLALWADDHETPGKAHAYATVYDEALRPIGPTVDVSPEADDVGRLAAQTVGDHVAVVYGDRRGARPGLFARWLDGDGRIAGPPVAVGASHAGASAPSIAGAGDGAAWALWEEERDANSVDLFVRKIGREGVLTPEVRLTDFANHGKKTRAIAPDLGASGASLHVLFRLDRDATRSLGELVVPLPDGPTHGALTAAGPNGDRTVGQLHMIASGPGRIDGPSLACDEGGCFGAWHADRGPGAGAHAAYFDAKAGQLIWRKRFAPLGGRPAVASAAAGGAVMSWYEGGRVRIASIGREGIGPPSTLARIAGDQPPASLTGENAGEWAIGWLDFEAGRLEPYAIRATCPATPAAPAALTPPAFPSAP